MARTRALTRSFFVLVGAAGLFLPTAGYAATCEAILGKWAWFFGGEVTVNRDGTFTQQSGNAGTWECTDGARGRFTFRWRDGGFVNSLVVSPDGQGLTSTDQSQAYVTAQRSAPAPPPQPVRKEDCCQEEYYCETKKIEAEFDQKVAQCHHPGNAGCFKEAVSTKAAKSKAAGEKLRLCNRTASGAASSPGPGTGGTASTAAGNDEFHSTERPGFFSPECACETARGPDQTASGGDTFGSNTPGSDQGQPQPGNERFDSSGGDRTPRDGSTRPPPPPSRVTPPAQQARAITRQYRLTVKSFIAHIGDNIGPTPRQPGDLVHADMNFRALAAAVDAGFNENPRDENQDKGYRLYSHLGVLVTCTGSRLTRYDIGQVFSDVGTEPARPIGGVVATTPPPMTIAVHPTRPSAHGVEFGWFGKGRPPDVIEAAMTVGVAGRNGRDIWHDVTARIVCTGDGPQIHAQLEASHFPSHRLWINNRLALTQSQGPLSAVWVGDPQTGLVR